MKEEACETQCAWEGQGTSKSRREGLWMKWVIIGTSGLCSKDNEKSLKAIKPSSYIIHLVFYIVLSY